MATGDYTDLASVHAYLDIPTSTTTYDGILQTFITACSRGFDRETARGNMFWSSNSAQLRLYNGSGTPWLDIDDFQSITSVTMSTLQDGSDAVTMSLTDPTSPYFIEVYPRPGEGPPFNRLFYLSTWRPDVYAVGNVAVTGVVTLPAEIQMAVTIWVAYLYKARNAGFADETGRPNGSGQARYAGGIPEQTQIIIDYYRAEEERVLTHSARLSPLAGDTLAGTIPPDLMA